MSIQLYGINPSKQELYHPKFTLPETNKSRLEIGRNPKENESSFNHCKFRGDFLVDRSGTCLFQIKTELVSFSNRPPKWLIFSSFYFSGNGWSSGIRQCREHHHDQNWPLASQKPSKYFVRRCFWAPSQTFSKRCLVTTKNHRLHSLILVFGRLQKPQKVAHPAKPSTWWGEHNSSYISISSGPSDGTMDCRVESARPALRGAAAVTLATWQGNVVAGSLPWMSSL